MVLKRDTVSVLRKDNVLGLKKDHVFLSEEEQRLCFKETRCLGFEHGRCLFFVAICCGVCVRAISTAISQNTQMKKLNLECNSLLNLSSLDPGLFARAMAKLEDV